MLSMMTTSEIKPTLQSMDDGMMKRCAKAGESPLSFCLSVEIVAIQKDLSNHNVLLAQRSDLAEYWSVKL